MEEIKMTDISGRQKIPLYTALMMAQVGQGLTFVILVGVLPQIAAYFGGGAHGELVAQQMATLPFLGIAIGGICSWPLISWLGLRGTILAASALFAMSGSVPIWCDSAWMMFPGCFLLGTCAALIVSAMTGMAGALFQGPQVSRIISFQVAFALFSASAVGLIVAYAARSWGWRIPFSGYVATGGVIFILTAIALPNIAAPRDGQGGFWSVLRGGALGFVLGFLTFLVTTANTVFTPFLMAAHGIADPFHRQMFMTISVVATFCGSLLYAGGQAKVSQRALCAFSTALLAVGLIILAIWQGNRYVIVVGEALFGTGTGVAIPALLAIAVLKNLSRSAQIVGIMNTSMYLGAAVTPTLLGPFHAAFGIPATYYLLAGGVCLVGVLVTLSSPALLKVAS